MNVGRVWLPLQNHLRGRDCGCVSVPESRRTIGWKGEAGAAGGGMAGPVIWQEVV